MKCARLFAAALFAAASFAVAARAEDPVVTPAPTPPPAAGPTKAAAEAFCGDVPAKADELIKRYTSDPKLKQVYKSAEYIAYADDEKNPTLMYTFTAQGPAHPAAVCRRVVKEGEAVLIKMTVVCGGEEEACRKLSNDFNVMTAKMQVEVDNKIKSGGK